VEFISRGLSIKFVTKKGEAIMYFSKEDDVSALQPRELYNRWHENVANRESVDHADAPWHRLAKRYMGKVEGKYVLEIGCGRGGFSQYLLDQGADLVAADYSDSAVAITNRLLETRPNFESQVADVQSLPFADATFDVVISLETLEHVPDPEKGLRELVRVTRKGGKLIITTPNYFGWMGLHRRWREATGRPWAEEGQPINHPLKLKDRVQSLKGLGCQIKVVKGRGHSLPIPGNKNINIDWLERVDAMKWFAAHSLTVAVKQ
jgi:2-polyprenyl-3-methyl-5-hydroxy-6-metoxy-1,4-benzoquinol methylase